MKTSRIWLAVLSVVILAGVFLAVSTTPVFGQIGEMPPTVEPGLQAQIQRDGSTGYMIYFRENADLSPAYEMDWQARGEYVVSTLKETANRSQMDVVKYLDDQNADFQAFWIDNIIIVNNSSQNTFNGLMSFAEIKSLRSRRMMSLIEPTVDAVPQSVLAIEPNISHVLAPDVWGQGITGSGIVVANIDTGVRSTHDALVRQYRGTTTGSHDYNWLGAAGGNGIPVDDHGHGTHTMGTMIGEDSSRTNQIGMAPGAQWIACDGCEGAGCPDAALLTCAQWIAAPYPIGDPASPNASMRPHAVNNSWGDCGTSYDNWYQASVDAWHAAGIYPIFSNGNASNCSYSSPPGLNTVGNPARYGNVTGVGSSGESNGQYATHSNWGPTDNLDTINPTVGWENLKPQVLAPGVSIRSSTPGSDAEYQDGWSGTSMSAPHVTGLVALIWQAGSCLVGDYATTETIIEDTAMPIPYDDGTGGGVHSPNYATGWGEINALAAIQAAQNLCGGGALTGTVTDSATTLPIPNLLIDAENITNTFQTSTGSDGIYSMDILTGTYDVTASLYGYLPETVSGVTIIDGGTTTQDFVMTPAETYLVSGVVTDTNTGWPLYASIDIDGYPGDLIWTDPVTGYYEVTLAEGITYTFDVDAWVPGYNPASSEIGPITGNIVVNFGLNADLGTCTAPGYTGGGSATFNDGLVPPAGWAVFDNENTGVIWDNLAGCGESGNFTGGSGDAACASSDIAGTAEFDTELWTPVFNDSQTQLSYLVNYQNFAGYDFLNVDISTDGGSNWTTILSWNEDHGSLRTTPGEQVVLDLSPYLAGTDNNIIRWHYFDPNSGDFDWYAQIDDVVLSDCTPPTDGGLVVGNVYDDNTNDALNGAMVDNEDGYNAEAAETPSDDSVDEAFFTIFSPSGTKAFTATLDAYMPDVASVSVTSGDTIRQDFYLSSGWLNVDPTSFHVTVDMGVSTTLPLTLTNQGANNINFELQENDIGFQPNLANLNVSQTYSEPAAVGPASIRSAEGKASLVDQNKIPNAWSGGTPLPAGDGVVRYGKAQCDYDIDSYYIIGGVNESLSVTANVWRYDATTDNWTGLADLPNPQEGSTAVCYEGFIYVLNGGGTNIFSIYDISTDSWVAGTAFPRNVWGAASGAYDGNVFFLGGDSDFSFGATSNQVDIYNIATGIWSTGTSMPTATVTALTVQAGQYVYVIGGWGDSAPTTNVNSSQRYDMISDTWETGPTFNSARADGSLAITQDNLYAMGGDADGGGAFDSTATIETLDWNIWPGGTWNDIGDPLPVAVTANNGGFCTEAITGGEVWSVGGADSSLTVYGNANYRESERCFSKDSDIPWLSEDPITGTIAISSDIVVDVTFDASVPEVDQPGDYLGALKVKNDTPYGNSDVPVTMTVLPPSDWGKLEGVVTGLGYCDTDPAALEDAEVYIESSSGLTLTLMTDSNGYYSWWFDESLSTFAIEVTYPEYLNGNATDVVVSAGSTTTQDFDLRFMEPCVSVDPANLEVTLIEGYSDTVSLDLINAGALATDFELAEKAGGYTPSMLFNSDITAPQIEVRERLAGYDVNAISTAGIFTGSGTPVMGVFAAGDVLNQWSTGHIISWGDGFDLASGTVWINDNTAGGGSGLNDEFTFAGSLTGASFTPSFGGSWPGDMAYNSNTDMFWQVNVGGDNCIYEWDPSIPAATGNSICGATWTAVSQRGLAWDPTDDSFFIGGWNENIIYHVASDGSIIEQWTTGLPISGLAYNWEDGQLFIMENSSTDTISQFDVTSGTVVNTFTVTGFGNFAGAGLAINCDGNLWAANQIDNNAYLIDSGVPGALCFSDIPWLSTDPITGTLAADLVQTIDVTFDTMTYTVGTYTGTLMVKTDDSMYNKIKIPVTMHVEAISYGVEVVAESDSLSGEPGSVVTYTVWVTNTGNVLDGYDMTAGTYGWDMDMPANVDPMNPGESHPMEVAITIPADASDGDSDSVTITVASQADPTETAVITLITEAVIPEHLIYLPLIYK